MDVVVQPLPPRPVVANAQQLKVRLSRRLRSRDWPASFADEELWALAGVERVLTAFIHGRPVATRLVRDAYAELRRRGHRTPAVPAC